jgi:hypothetical protein
VSELCLEVGSAVAVAARKPVGARARRAWLCKRETTQWIVV